MKARVPDSLKLAATHEKDLSATQSQARAHARVSGPDGDAGRTQHLEAAPREGPGTAGDLDSSQAAWLEPPACGFDATARLHRRSEYLRAQRNGLRYQTPHFALYAATISSLTVRVGITVSRRIGEAVVRNRVKRRVRECFRLELRPLLAPGTDLIVIARMGAGGLQFTAIREELTGAVRTLRRRLAS